MNKRTDHPDDLSPYLDHDSLDPRCKEIEIHLDTCSRCRDELRTWQSVDALIRTNGDRIDVPPFQWQRIAAQLQTPLPMSLLARFRLLLQPWKPAWNVTAAVILSVALLTGLEYHKNYEEKQLLLAVSRYAAAEQLKLGSEENPFRTATISDRADESNPFAVRR